MQYPRVSIILLNWNGWKDTIECLESLYRINYTNYDIIVVDNFSQDKSIEKIKEYSRGKIKINSKFFEYDSKNKPINIFEISEDDVKNNTFSNKEKYEKIDPNKRMILIKNKDNYGFTGGNNIGIKFALNVLNTDYVLLLNNDTVVDPNFLIELVKTAENNKDVGVVGSKIYYYNNPEKIWFLGGYISKDYFGIHYYYNKKDDKKYEKEIICTFLTGCTLLIKKEVIENVGLLDNRFFCYNEDVDFCYRCLKKGYKLICNTDSIIYHKGSASSGSYSPFSVYYSTRNYFLFLNKHINNPKKSIYILKYLLTKFPKRFFGYLIILRKPYLIKSLLKGIIHGIRNR